jgi:predicted ATPase
LICYSQDPGVVGLSYMAHVLWLLGYPDQALEKTREALNLAHTLAHPFTLAFAMNFACEIHQLRGDMKASQEQAEALIALASEQGFPLWLAGGMVQKGHALFEQGKTEEGMAQMRQAMNDFQTIGIKVGKPGGLATQALVLVKVGQIEEGLNTLAEAFATVENNDGEKQFTAELYRIKGELLLMQAASGQKANFNENVTALSLAEQQAEQCFHHALAIARDQGAKSWELRAATSLSRLWQRQGQKTEARKLLAEIYGWFTEGFDTEDLREVKTLLEELRERKT